MDYKQESMEPMRTSPSKDPDASPRPVGGGAPLRILLADDQPDVRSALRLLLEQGSGLEVQTREACDADGLLQEALAGCPDLVLLDWELPGLPAAGLLAALRRGCGQVWIVAMSGRPEAQGLALAAGADAFISKGDPPDRLLAAVAACWNSLHLNP